MADENKKTSEDTNRGGGRASTKRPRPGGNTPAGNPISDQTQDAFQLYKEGLEQNEIPPADNDRQTKQETLNTKMEMRRNQMIFVKNLEENQREYQAMNFNITSLMGNDANEVKVDMEGFNTTYESLKTLLAAARSAIKEAKTKLGALEESARRIEDAKDDSTHSEQIKLLRRGILGGNGLKNFDDSIAEIVDKTDEAHDLSDDAREKEIIVEGIAAYINASSLGPKGAAIKTKVDAFKQDVDANVAEATTDVEREKTVLVARLTELSQADAAKDRSELFLGSLQETADFIGDIAGPEENIREILQQVEQTFEGTEDESTEDEGEEI